MLCGPWAARYPGCCLNQEKIKEKLAELLRDRFPGLSPAGSLSRQLNSLQLVELVKEIEARFGIEVSSLEIDEENFADLGSVEALIRRKQSDAPV